MGNLMFLSGAKGDRTADEAMSPNSTRLDLKNNGLKSLPLKQLSQMSNLSWLNLSHNALEALPVEVCQLSKLTVLRLFGNQLKVVPVEVGQLTLLTTLDLGKNRLTSLPVELGQLVALKELSVHWNHLTEVPVEVARLTALKTLNVYINKLRSLPLELEQLTEMETLDIAHNELRNLPPCLRGMTRLQTLKAPGNRLRRLGRPDVLQALSTNLTRADLSGNDLHQLPPAIAGLTKLRQLHLHHNRLSSLCPLASMTALTELSLACNDLVLLPSYGAFPPSLRTIVLFSNRLTSLPSDLSTLTALLDLDLGDNLLTDIDFTSFSASDSPPSCSLDDPTQEDAQDRHFLPALQRLCLNQNLFHQLPRALSSIPSLRELNLGSNQLQQLEPSTLAPLTALTRLVLSQNELSYWPEGLTSLRSLSVLELADNHFQTFPEEIFSFQNLQFLNLSCNGIHELPDTDQWAQLTRLNRLYVAYNGLEDLPKSLHACASSLNELQLAGNQFSAWPSVLFQLTSLQGLCIANNYLVDIPSQLSALSKLETLLLNGNSITELSPEGVLPLKELKELDLSFNELSSLPKELFINKGRLIELNLVANFLTDLPDECSQLSLSHLLISFNLIPDERLPVLSNSCWISSECMRQPRSSSNSSGDYIGDASQSSHPSASSSASSSYPRRRSATKTSPVTSLKLSPARRKYARGRSSSWIKLPSNRSLGRSSGREEKDKDTIVSSSRLSGSLRGSLDMIIPSKIAPTVNFGCATLKGRRPEQQDTSLVLCNFRKEGEHLFAIFDGHAGTHSSQLAADTFPALLRHNLNKYSDPSAALTRTFDELHQDIAKRGYDDGTAALVALIMQDELWLAHAGDSRAVLCRDGRAVPLSVDHKPDNAEEGARIRQAGGFVTEKRRVCGVLALSRALGDCDLQPAVTWLPDIKTMTLGGTSPPLPLALGIEGGASRHQSEDHHNHQGGNGHLSPYSTPALDDESSDDGSLSIPNDEMLILGCDGLWDVMSNEQALEAISSETDPVRAAIKLRDMAYALGSMDNISIIVVRFSAGHEPHAGAALTSFS
ncbi:Protein phosphatase 1G [Balamuthia mandrillaris]